MQKSKIFIIFVLSFLLPLNFANAYLDPGTGSILLQVLLAGFLGALLYIKTFFRMVKSWFVKPKKEDETKDSEEKKEDWSSSRK
ncbi:MAG: hypothetical protein NTV65_07080 [Proteobacteria bacterium]|nr:hypothetical protein [Pseudomonadota bacterium]